jgi:hypothetical protein
LRSSAGVGHQHGVQVHVLRIDDGRMPRKVLWRGAENDVGVRQQPRDEVPVQRLGARIRMVTSAEWSRARAI